MVKLHQKPLQRNLKMGIGNNNNSDDGHGYDQLSCRALHVGPYVPYNVWAENVRKSLTNRVMILVG